MTNINPAQTKSIEAKLLKLANSQQRSPMDQRTLFLLERALARLVLDPDLHKGLVFKGGFVAMRVYGSERFTTDLDATLQSISSELAVKKIRKSMAEDISDGAWFLFESEEAAAGQGEYEGISLKFRCGIGDPPTKLEKALRIGIDIGVGDPVTPGSVSTQTSATLGYDEISWSVYPVESMIAEKLHALLHLGSRNSRSKDIYDLNLFWDRANLVALKGAIERTFMHRKFKVPSSFADAVAAIDTTILRRGWSSAMASISDKKIFEEVLDDLIVKIRTSMLD